MEFWPYNYTPNNQAGIPNANSGTFDFGDQFDKGGNYGSMQIHNYGASQTVMAFNNWNNGGGDIGIGNQVGGSGQPDWTFANNAGNYTVKDLQVVVGGAAQPTAPYAPANITANDPSLASYHVVYQMSVPNSSNFNTNITQQPIYTANYSGAPNLAPSGIHNVAYYVDLHNSVTSQDQWVSVSFAANSLGTNDPSKFGLPTLQTQELYNNALNHLHVASNVAGVPTGDNLAGGVAQFWPSDYASNPSTGVFDYGSTGGNNTVPGYGRMEISAGTTTLFALNNWGSDGGAIDLGIGNNPSGNPDWTFAHNAGDYSVKDIYVLAQNVPEPSTWLLSAFGLAGLLGVARRRRAAVS